MVAPQAFKVLTEFKFDVGAAMVSSGKLQEAVGKVSDKADQALFSLQRLSTGLVLDLGLGGGSILGILGNAIKASETFRKSQLDFTNIISANVHLLQGDIGNFNSQMMVSKNILRDIAKDAQKFGLNENTLAAQTKQTAAMLVPKGLAGNNFGAARDLSRNLLKSAPSLGVDPGLVQGQLSRTIEGRASMGDTLFIRLMNETQAFQQKLKGAENAAKAFNKLPLKERFATLQAGMAQFANDANVLAARADTFGQLFQRIRNVFVGFNGILKPLGDVIAGPIKKALISFIKIVEKDGRRIFQELSFGIRSLVPDIETMIVNLIQLKKAAQDFNMAAKATGSIGILGLVSGFISFGAVFKGLKVILPFIVRGFGMILPILAKIGPILGWIASAAVKVFPVFLAIFGVLQLISRAIAIANVNDAKILPGIIADIMGALNLLKSAFEILFSPFAQMFNAVAEFISPLFQIAVGFKFLRSIVETVTTVLVSALAGIQGAIFAILQVIDNLKSGKILSAFDGIEGAFNAGADSFLDKVFKQSGQIPGDGSGILATVQPNVNIGRVEINQDFKEKFEPDRVAFSVKSQLMKLSQNPTQAAGQGFSLTGQGR